MQDEPEIAMLRRARSALPVLFVLCGAVLDVTAEVLDILPESLGRAARRNRRGPDHERCENQQWKNWKTGGRLDLAVGVRHQIGSVEKVLAKQFHERDASWVRDQQIMAHRAHVGYTGIFPYSHMCIAIGRCVERVALASAVFMACLIHQLAHVLKRAHWAGSKDPGAWRMPRVPCSVSS